MPEFTYLVSPDFDPTVVPEGYIWDETAFKELAKATDKAVSDQTIYTYGGAQGDSDVVYENAADLTISNRKYDAGGQVVDTTITANTFNNTGMVTTDGVIVFSVQNFSNSGTFNLDSAASVTFNDAVTNAAAARSTSMAAAPCRAPRSETTERSPSSAARLPSMPRSPTAVLSTPG